MNIIYKINCEEAGREYPHYWEYCVGRNCGGSGCKDDRGFTHSTSGECDSL